jgi:quercetin dioxygenase-like cupin family protein
MIDMLQIENSTQRGVEKELLSDELVNSVTYITCKKGYVIGNQYHKYTTHQNYVVSGELLVVTQTNDNEIVKKTHKKGEMYTIVPMEKHAIFAIQDTELLVLAKGPNDNKEFESDTHLLWEPLIR